VKKLKNQVKFYFPRELKTYLFLIISACIAIIFINAFVMISDTAHQIFRASTEHYPTLFLILTPLSFTLIIWGVKKYLPYIAGSGIPQVFAAFDSKHKNKRHKLLGFKMAIYKIILVSLATLIGAPVGLVGPSVSIGSAVFYGFVNYINLKRKMLIHNFIAVGGSLGLVLMLNTPLAGISFALEEMARGIKKQNIALLVILITLSYYLNQFFNPAIYLTNLQVLLEINQLLPLVLVVIICGLIGGLFAKFNLIILDKLITNNKTQFIFIILILGSIITILNFLSKGLISGSGKAEILLILAGENLGVEFLIMKIIAVFSSLISTIPGGLFVPSISIGASFGDVITSFIGFDSQFIILMSMVSYLAAITRTPITASLVVLEITTTLNLLPIALIVAFISNYISKFIQPKPFYFALAEKFS
jgi:H+/Cl- antiporter ClcA